MTKTNLTDFVRCPYAFWLLQRGRISRADLFDVNVARRVAEGDEFDDAVKASAAATLGSVDELSARLGEDVELLGLPETFENARLRIRGRPDGIDTANGALVPIEAKAHKNVQPLDKLELAFYWLLLEPHRTRHPRRPTGILILRDGGEQKRVRVPITPRLIERVRDYLVQIRHARTHGVPPRVCSCNVCGLVVRKAVLRAVRQRDDLTRISGVGVRRAMKLEDAGIKTCAALLKQNPIDVASLVSVSPRMVEAWQHHARAHATKRPVVFGTEALPTGPIIALDLEYEPGLKGLVWLIGGCVLDGVNRREFSFWAESPTEERKALGKLLALLAQQPGVPIVTWSGNNADLVALRHAAKRAQIPNLSTALAGNPHTDLYGYMNRNMRLPIPDLGLKDVASHLGISRASQVRDGLQALLLFNKFQRAGGKQRRSIKRRLLAYNRDDVLTLIATLEKLSMLVTDKKYRAKPGRRSATAVETSGRSTVQRAVDPEEEATSRAELGAEGYRHTLPGGGSVYAIDDAPEDVGDVDAWGALAFARL